MSRDRSQRREAERKLEKIIEAREKLFAMSPGGAPDNPILLGSASLVEARATSIDCPRCAEPTLRVEEHTAETVGGARLRTTRLRCAQCGRERRLWFKLGSMMAN